MPKPGAPGTGDDALNTSPIPPADYTTAAHNRSKPAPPPPGPAPRPPATGHSTSHAAPGPYDLSGFAAGAIAEADQEATNFAEWLGWPSWFNYNAMVKSILQSGMQADANQAYEYLWTQLNADQQKANPNVYFGLTKQQYTEKTNNLSDMFQMFTGQTAVPESLRNQALRENWSQSELLTALQADSTIGATSPWLSAGQTFRDVMSQFNSQYGDKPKDKDQLASWWRFKTGAAQVGGGQVAHQTYQPPQPRTIGADVETR